METLISDEFRLAYLVLLAAATFAGAWRFVRRRVQADWADRAADALLLCFLVQYLSVCIPGVLGVLNPLTIAATTLLLAAVLFFAPARDRVSSSVIENRADRWVVLICTWFAISYAFCSAFEQAFTPVLHNDGVTYHFPAAVHWLQAGRLSVYEAWFFNPANTYSPLAGSTFIAWWIAPLGTDVIARHEQFWALVLIYFASLRLSRAIGGRPAVAAVIAAALVLSQPVLRQSISEKDDLYLTAFFACAIAACAPQRLRDPLGPWRIGIALGLMLATKYSALLVLPALLLVVDAPARASWRWRQYAIALAVATLLAGPWYLRNFLQTANPLYPVRVDVLGHTLLPGLFSTAASQQIRSITGLWDVLTRRQQSLPLAPMIALLFAYFAAMIQGARRLRVDPLTRASLLGPIIILLIFWRFSPFPEARYALPALVLAFSAGALAIAAWLRPLALQLAAASLLLILCWGTVFVVEIDGVTNPIAKISGAAILVTAAGLAVAGLMALFPARRRRIVLCAALAVVLPASAWVFVYWDLFLRSCHLNAFADRDSPARITPQYRLFYGDAADVWSFVEKSLPPAEPLAYANTFYVHPLHGFRHERRLIYVPTRRGVLYLRDLPPVPGQLPSEQVIPAFAAALTADTDEAGWLTRLFASGATHLVVFHNAVVPNPPELAIARAHPQLFEPVFQNAAATVYRLHK